MHPRGKGWLYGSTKAPMLLDFETRPTSWHGGLTILGFEFGFWRPAKGSGSIFIAARLRAVREPHWLLSCSGFTPELLDWFRQVSKVLADCFPERVVEGDYGFDT